MMELAMNLISGFRLNLKDYYFFWFAEVDFQSRYVWVSWFSI